MLCWAALLVVCCVVLRLTSAASSQAALPSPTLLSRLLFFAGSNLDSEWAYSGGARQTLFRLAAEWADPELGMNDGKVRKTAWQGCPTAAEEVCLHYSGCQGWPAVLERSPAPALAHHAPPSQVEDYQTAQRESKFCLAAYGWGWGVRLHQAILAGCIPVIVAEHVFQPYEVSRRGEERGHGWRCVAVCLQLPLQRVPAALPPAPPSHAAVMHSSSSSPQLPPPPRGLLLPSLNSPLLLAVPPNIPCPQEVLPYEAFSIRLTNADLPQLREILRGVTDAQYRRERVTARGWLLREPARPPLRCTLGAAHSQPAPSPLPLLT